MPPDQSVTLKFGSFQEPDATKSFTVYKSGFEPKIPWELIVLAVATIGVGIFIYTRKT